jgi:hypothetical protein
MAAQQGMIPEHTINGSFGEVRDENGDWLVNVQEVTFRITIDRQEIMMSGTRRKGYKATSTAGEGTLRQFKVTTAFIKRVSELMRDDRQLQFVGQLMVKLDDPDSLGTERVLLKGVKFWEINGGWRVGEIIEEEIPFTFEDIDFPDEITGDPSVNQNRYAPLA